MLPFAVMHARGHRIAQHRVAMISIFIGALVIAGLFTLLPSRVMHTGRVPTMTSVMLPTSRGCHR
jgi:uncharacterized membrane protein